MIFIDIIYLKKPYSADQVTKLTHLLKLLTNALMQLVIEQKMESFTHYTTRGAVSEAVIEKLAKRSIPTIKTLTLAFLLILYPR